VITKQIQLKACFLGICCIEDASLDVRKHIVVPEHLEDSPHMLYVRFTFGVENQDDILVRQAKSLLHGRGPVES
jgi:hypothetical protein